MLRLSGFSLLLLTLTGLMMGVMVADQADSQQEATIEIDYETGQLYVAEEAVGEPMTTVNNTSIFQPSAHELPMADVPGNTVDFSFIRAQMRLTQTMFDLTFAVATMTAQFILATPIPVAIWMEAIEVGTLLVMGGYGFWKVLEIRRLLRR
jgi:hypothetical protein